MGAMFGWIAIGLIIGLIGKFLMPGRDPGGLVVTALLGIAGAILAGLGAQVAGVHRYGELAPYGAAVVGAIALLTLYRIVMKTRG